MLHRFFPNPHAKSKAGFTLIEMLVALAIVFIMTAFSMANYNRFGREVELENATYELALNIRQAQFFGINRSEQYGATIDDPQPYGVYFNLAGTEQGIDDESFIMFVDQDGSRSFDAGDDSYNGNEICLSNPSNECINVLRFTQNNYMSDICVGADENSCNSITEDLHVTFKRPDPDATIRVGTASTNYSYAKITLSSPVADIPEKHVSIGAAGLISID